jgi:uncharacterized protein with von Willebrand factor type A (vWA) domain
MTSDIPALPADPARTQLRRARWKLILGGAAAAQLPGELNEQQQRISAALDFLYSREFTARGARSASPPQSGALAPGLLDVPRWLGEIRELFPQPVVERITTQALERYHLTELLTDPRALDMLTPSPELLAAMLRLQGLVPASLLQQVRRLIEQVVRQLQQQLRQPVLQTLQGERRSFRRSVHRSSRTFDFRSTIRRNLKHWDPARQQLIVAQPEFTSRTKRTLPWEVILCVDQSASMAENVIHAAILSGILHTLPTVRTRTILFDTALVDLSEISADPVELLLKVQLGGGTDIGQAVRYCEQLITLPTRTVFVLLSDFYEGASPQPLLAACRRLREAGVRTLGLTALSHNSQPQYDAEITSLLAADGMELAALTPLEFARWLGDVMN